jgi:hypothetical protein
MQMRPFKSATAHAALALSAIALPLHTACIVDLVFRLWLKKKVYGHPCHFHELEMSSRRLSERFLE